MTCLTKQVNRVETPALFDTSCRRGSSLSLHVMRIVLLLILISLLTGCGRESCLNDAEVRGHFAEAAKFELDGKLQAARSKYKEVDLYACDARELSLAAESNAIRLSQVIQVAYDDTQSVLNAYLAKNGRYPDTLEEVRDQIPERSRPAFSSFNYVRRSDKEMAIVTGLYGMHTFDLNGR